MGRQAQADAAQAKAEELRPFLEEMQAAGITTAKGLARELNDQGFETRRGGRWDHKAVRRILDRLEAAGELAEVA
jgi:hypothetical protein